MMEVLTLVSWTEVIHNLTKILVAFALVIPVAWDSEKHGSGAGLRTFPLVAMASCGYVLVGLSVLEGSESQARILYGLMTGIGFIGGGAIVKKNNGSEGTATAASIWSTGAVGACVAWNRFEIALVLAVVNFLVFRYVRRLGKNLGVKNTTE